MDGCNAGAGCTHKGLSGACEDGNPCTKGDACFNAVCMPGPGLDCGDGNPCTDDGCAGATGCTHLPGTATCSDGNACTVGDVCANTVCTPGGQVNCNDDDPCTSDACQSATGCVHKATSGACDDGDPCTVADSCKNGVCHGGGPASCDDGNACTFDKCDSAKGCLSASADGNGCSDGNVCTASDVCAGGACQSGTVSGCDDGNPCTADGCDAQTGCSHLAQSGACDDGSACTLNDTCWNTVCTGDSPCDCTDGNPCTDDPCSATSGCGQVPNSATCTDSNACTTGDHCAGGSCLYSTVVTCNENNPCTTDSCDPISGACIWTPDATLNGTACSDGSVCTTTDGCLNGVCNGGAALNCDDANVCTDDPCNASSGCSHVTNGLTTCDDGNACTVGDHCVGTTCAGTTKNCDDSNACTQDSCNAVTGACSNPNLPDSTTCAATTASGATCTKHTCTTGVCGSSTLNCNDGNACATHTCDAVLGCLSAPVGDGTVCASAKCVALNFAPAWTCVGTSCTSAPTQYCDDSNPCTVDSCDAVAGCKHVSVSDATACGSTARSGSNLQGALCIAGTCQYNASLSCDDGSACTTDTCQTNKCTHTAVVDGTVCGTGSCNGLTLTQTQKCSAGGCITGATKTTNCDDGSNCTLDTCDATTGCKHITTVWHTWTDPTNYATGSTIPEVYSIVTLPKRGFATAGAVSTFTPISAATDVGVRSWDENGNQLWSASLGLSGAAPTTPYRIVGAADGGMYVVGSHGGTRKVGFFARVESYGSVTWLKTFDSDVRATTLFDVVELSGGGIAMCGSASGGSAGTNGGWLVTADASGTVLVNKVFPDANAAGSFSAIAQLTGGKLVLVGSGAKVASGAQVGWSLGASTAGVKAWSNFGTDAKETDVFALPGGGYQAITLTAGNGGFQYIGQACYSATGTAATCSGNLLPANSADASTTVHQAARFASDGGFLIRDSLIYFNSYNSTWYANGGGFERIGPGPVWTISGIGYGTATRYAFTVASNGGVVAAPVPRADGLNASRRSMRTGMATHGSSSMGRRSAAPTGTCRRACRFRGATRRTRACP